MQIRARVVEETVRLDQGKANINISFVAPDEHHFDPAYAIDPGLFNGERELALAKFGLDYVAHARGRQFGSDLARAERVPRIGLWVLLELLHKPDDSINL